MTYNVWAQMPQLVNGKRSWSLIAQSVPFHVANIYRETFLFPLHVEETEK